MELVTRKEAAKHMKMSPVTLAIWDRKYPKRLKAITMPNGRIRYDMERIREFLAACQVTDDDEQDEQNVEN